MFWLFKMLFLASLAWNIDLLGSTFLGRRGGGGGAGPGLSRSILNALKQLWGGGGAFKLQFHRERDPVLPPEAQRELPAIVQHSLSLYPGMRTCYS